MADQELAKALKDLPIRIQTASKSERRALVDNVVSVLAHPNITESIVRGICKVLTLTIPRYVDVPSQSLIRKLIEALVAQHSQWVFRHLVPTMHEFASRHKTIAAGRNTADTALNILSWTCIVMRNGLNAGKEELLPEMKTLVDAQAMLLYAVYAGGTQKQKSKATKQLLGVWNNSHSIPVQYLTSSELSDHGLVYGAQFIAYLHQKKITEDVVKIKVALLDGLTKICISCKKKPDEFIVPACRGLVSLITHEEFSSQTLPALEKAMLRSPEIILKNVSLLLAGLSLDLSQYAMAIGKQLIANLHSKEDACRDDAVEGCHQLARQCSDSAQLKKVIDHLFAVFQGSEGKLTVSTHKISVLQGVGYMSDNAVTGSSVQGLAEGVIAHMKTIAETEVHEKTLVQALEMMARWCARLTSVPEPLIKWFHTGINLKTSTAAVRTAYIDCMAKTFNGNTLSQGEAVMSILSTSIEKGSAGGSPAQLEALTAACLLLKLTTALDLFNNPSATSVRSSVLDPERQLFVNDKFLSSTSEEGLSKVLDLCERIIHDHQEQSTAVLTPVLRALLFCLTSSFSSVRSKARTVVKRIVSMLGGTPLAIALIHEFKILLSNRAANKVEEAAKGDASTTEKAELTSHVLADALMCLCSGTNLTEEDAHQITLAALFCAHNPLITLTELAGATSKDLWLKLVKIMSVDAPKLILLHKTRVLRETVAEFQPEASAEAALATLVRLAPDIVLPRVLEQISPVLKEASNIHVTRDEYFTYLTPEGELYDKSIISGRENEQNAKNLKRESKLYTYKEQMEEIQLRREIEEKKRREGKLKEPELTPKQKEQVRLQLEKETAVRARLADLNAKLFRCSSMLQSALSGDVVSVSRYYNELIPLLQSNFNSPVASPIMTKLFLRLGAGVLTGVCAVSGQLIGHVTLRLLKPQCDLDPAWEVEPLPAATERAMSDLAMLTTEGPLPGPSYCFCFPFTRTALLTRLEDEAFALTALQVLLVHANSRALDPKSLRHPRLLPRQQILQLLVSVIGRGSKRVQAEASRCLLEMCEGASGAPGTCRASRDEIDALLAALQDQTDIVRDAGLRGLTAMHKSFPSMKEDYDQRTNLIRRVWVACSDPEEENSHLARALWKAAKLEPVPNVLSVELMKDVVHPVPVVQESAAKSIAALVKANLNLDLVPTILENLQNIYSEKLVMIPPKIDHLGRVTEESIDTWEPRSGVALALQQLAPFLEPATVSKLVAFFVSTGLADKNAEVRKNMLNAALNIVDLHGKDTVSGLLPVFEEFMDQAPDSSSFDAVRQSVVILMGSLARHLDKDDPRIKPIVERLIDALSTPSQQVQEAVANCLPPLVPAIKDDAPAMVASLLHQLLESENYGERKGAAYGLAGLVKGLGILALKQLNIMTILTEAIQNKKNHRHREGALFAFEMLCTMLGRLFEPYIVHVLPFLLLCFGDSSQFVRDATDDTARVVMSRLSAHGVKLVLPSLLGALEEDSWRTKTGSVELLGAMAFCAPKQLSSCLPSIVPKLIEVLSDSHIKVQKAGAQALKQIGSVIRNPEIQAIVPVLLQALQEPAMKTATSLQSLLDTKFVHFIDAPSLALIMPVVQRAFMDRSTETRKMAAQIIGNMYSLTDQKDLCPYLPNIIPGLKMSLLDPVPEVRSVSARALGAMVRGMGESSFEDLLPWLMQTLTSETSSVDRSGAAQGLSEVVGGLGVEKLHKLMPDIIATAERTDIAPHVKDGYIMMFIYMPAVFTNEFTPYIGQIINPILKALADENEYVRETALKAGQRIVNLYADSAIMLLLPQLESGLFDDNWRIRYSSVQLLGDLLYRISGVTGKMSTETADEDDNFGTEQSHSAIIDALGPERRNRVLAGLYMGRSDVALMVRQSALHVWKVVVTNTPRTLREILPTLFSLLLGCLASTSLDKRQVAARTLGDLVRKLGERVLPEIIPILERGLESDAPDQRQGVCIGLSEIMASTSRDMVLTFVNSLVPTVRKALCDPLPEVRQAAAKTFDSLHATVGARALDDILPAMLHQLNTADEAQAECTLDGLRQVMAIKSRVVLPYLIPQLTASPVNTKALSMLACVAGEALTKYLSKILPALLAALTAAQGTPQQAEELEYCQAVVLSVTDEVGIRTIMDQLMDNTKSNQVQLRKSATTLLCAFCANTRADYSQYVPQLLRGLIHLFTDEDDEVLMMSWEALSAVTKTLDATQQAMHVGDVRQAVRFAASDLKGAELLPGFCLPKGITPILPIFREAILNGAPEVKEQAAQGLGEVIRLTSAQALQPSVVHITGPLIRIVGDRFNWSVKAAVLETLALLLARVGVMLKQFLPQLQTTFVKALNDPNRTVRLRAAHALGHLIVIHTRADPLFVELHNGVKTADDPAIRETMLQALRGVITPAGDKMAVVLRKQVHATLVGLLNHPEDTTRQATAGCLGALMKYLPIDLIAATVNEYLLNDDATLEWTVRHGRSCALYVTLKEAPETIYVPDWQEKLHKVLLAQLAVDRVPIAMNGVRACGYLFQHLMTVGSPLPMQLLTPFVRTMNHTSNDVKQLLARVCSYLARVVPQAKTSPEYLRLAIPTLVNGTKEKNGYVKANSELALVAVLGLRHGEDTFQKCSALLDTGARESLSDVVSKVLKKTVDLPEGKEEDLDDTILT